MRHNRILCCRNYPPMVTVTPCPKTNIGVLHGFLFSVLYHTIITLQSHERSYHAKTKGEGLFRGKRHFQVSVLQTYRNKHKSSLRMAEGQT